jgi:16S rRNA (uracil1498-N3)-methyltransferase
MQVFYSDHIDGNHIILDNEEFRHCVKVLRKSSGDTLNVTDGLGNWYQCEIEHVGKSNLIAHILQTTKQDPSPYIRAIAIAPTKNADKIEFFVEKSIEIGIDKIALMFTEKTERSRINMDRIHKIAISAMKQSLHFFLPEILEFKNTQAALEYFSGYDKKGIAHCNNAPIAAVEFFNESTNSVIFIGPEGDFTKDEISLAKSFHFQELHLGTSRLRTETAGIVSAVWLNQNL